MMMKKYFLFLAVLLFTQGGKAQDIEALLNAPLLTVNGGISINQIATFTPGDSTATTDPYALFIGGNLNLSFFGVVDVPMSFAYTNQQLSKSVVFHKNLKYIVVSFERKVKTNDLKLFLDMAKYLGIR